MFLATFLEPIHQYHQPRIRHASPVPSPTQQEHGYSLRYSAGRVEYARGGTDTSITKADRQDGHVQYQKQRVVVCTSAHGNSHLFQQLTPIADHKAAGQNGCTEE